MEREDYIAYIVRELSRRAELNALMRSPCKNKYDIMRNAYWDATINELLKRIKESRGDIEHVISSFARRMDRHEGLVYSVSHDAAMWLLDEYLLYEEK